MLNFFLMTGMAVFFFHVPLTGSFFGLTLAALIYVTATTALGFLVSVFITSQVAALFATAMLTMIPAVSIRSDRSGDFAFGALVGSSARFTHDWFVTAAQGSFSKAFGIAELIEPMLAMGIAVPVILGACTIFLQKQAR